MGLYGYRSRDDNRTDREVYLESEVERYREADNQRLEDERRERERRQAERMEELEERMRTANTWPEALRKQIFLFNREIALEDKMLGDFGLPVASSDLQVDNWFRDGVKACERALEIWREVEAENAKRIAELERQIQAVRDETREAVAARLESERDDLGWSEVVRAMREDTPSDWLYW